MVSQTNEMIILKFARVHINAGHLTNRPGREHQTFSANDLKIGTFLNKTTEHAISTFQEFFSLFIKLW